MEKNMESNTTNGVQYRRAKTWQIAFSQLSSGSNVIFYLLVGLMSYLANAGYGIAVAVVGIILTGTRIFDGLIDPFIAMFIDKFNSKHGKIRIILSIGWVIRAIATYMLFIWGSGKGYGVVFFVFTYLIYIIGNSISDVAAQITGPIMTNDPKQRPTINVWSTIYNFVIPMVFSVVTTVVILPMYGNEYTVEMLATTCIIYIIGSLILTILSFIGIAPVDKKENFEGISANDNDDVKVKDMIGFLKENKPFQMYLISGASDKLAQQVGAQAVVNTMMFGILMGNIQFGSILNMISMLPSILFAIIGARYAGKHGNKKTMVDWTKICIVMAAISIAFCFVIDMSKIPTTLSLTIIFFALSLLLNGAKMCVTTSNGAMRADIIDYELDRSGKYIPAVVTATYNFFDQLFTALASTIALGCVALIGYSAVMPQPNDPSTRPIFMMTMFLYYGLPILGWLTTIAAMRFYNLTREEMVDVQQSIHDKKERLEAENSIVS
ncbi:MAG: sugar transporter [Clostridiales bacterium]|nr:sugar transporter [Clostridiales bacterium]